MIAFITFFILCLGLLIVVAIRRKRISGPTDMPGSKEGFNPMSILKTFSKFGKTVKKFVGRFKYLGKGFAGLGPAFGTMFKNFGIMTGGVFTNTFQYTAALGVYTFAWVKCTSEKLKNLHFCFLFYLLDLFIYLNYILILSVCVLLDAILRIKRILGVSLESMVVQAIDQLTEVDNLIYSTVGIHFFQYPDIILNACYRCKNPPNKKGMRKAKDKYDYDFKVKYPRKASEITKRFKDVGRNFKKFFS